VSAGLRLAADFCQSVVRPLLDEAFPGLDYAAALLGPGSEVLGYDTRRSTDHDWGPRLQVLLADGAEPEPVLAVLAERLPATFRGYPVAFPRTGDPDVRHRVVVSELGAWLTGQLGFDPRRGVALADWLTTPTQRLAEFTTGAVFHDGPGELTAARSALAWYPQDVWLYVLACQWHRIAQEEAFPGRCAEVGDALGSAVVAARLVRDVMRLWLLMHRHYPPYSKWLGTAFAQVSGTGPLAATLTAAVSAAEWPAREQHLCAAYTLAAEEHNRLGLTAPLDPTARSFYDRPYQVLAADRFATALTESITDPAVKRLPPTGAVDQFTDSTDALNDLPRLRAGAGNPALPRCSNLLVIRLHDGYAG